MVTHIFEMEKILFLISSFLLFHYRNTEIQMRVQQGPWEWGSAPGKECLIHSTHTSPRDLVGCVGEMADTNGWCHSQQPLERCGNQGRLLITGEKGQTSHPCPREAKKTWGAAAQQTSKPNLNPWGSMKQILLLKAASRVVKIRTMIRNS